MKQLQFGLKVWSSNRQYIAQAREFLAQGVCSFIELYVDPRAVEADLEAWKVIEKGIRLHAPHSYGGFNPSRPEKLEGNLALLAKVEAYRKAFLPGSIVFHPGIDGTLKESLRQFKRFARDFPEIYKVALIENKPKLGAKGELCIGASVSEIKVLIESVNFRFCLDFGHAVCAAAWAGVAWQQVVDDFLKLNPSLYHLCDGTSSSPKDSHLHFGQGDFDLMAMLAKLPENAHVTIETPHDYKDSLDDFRHDVQYLKGIQ